MDDQQHRGELEKNVDKFFGQFTSQVPYPDSYFSRKYDGVVQFGSQIRILIFFHPGCWVKKAPDPRSRSVTLVYCQILMVKGWRCREQEVAMARREADQELVKAMREAEEQVTRAKQEAEQELNRARQDIQAQLARAQQELRHFLHL
jgi:hypothetical protein